jgi:hypothetical protein
MYIIWIKSVVYPDRFCTSYIIKCRSAKHAQQQKLCQCWKKRVRPRPIKNCNNMNIAIFYFSLLRGCALHEFQCFPAGREFFEDFERIGEQSTTGLFLDRKLILTETPNRQYVRNHRHSIMLTPRRVNSASGSHIEFTIFKLLQFQQKSDIWIFNIVTIPIKLFQYIITTSFLQICNTVIKFWFWIEPTSDRHVFGNNFRSSSTLISSRLTGGVNKEAELWVSGFQVVRPQVMTSRNGVDEPIFLPNDRNGILEKERIESHGRLL